MLFGNPVRGRIGRFRRPDPESGFVVTRPYNDPRFSGMFGLHDGLDIDNGGPPGDPILAMAAGTVIEQRIDDHGARIVRIKHSVKFSTGYAHLDQVFVVLGQRVKKGQQIGTLGSTGFVTGPHLHFDITEGTKRQDPWPLLEQNHPRKEDWMPLPLRERYERWTVPAGTPFFTDGPGIGTEKRFTVAVKAQTVAESADGKWRLLRFQNAPNAKRELLYVRRSHIVPKVQGGEPTYDAKVVKAIQAP